MADPEIDAVYIPLPNHLHAEWTIAAAKAGKHILCEKPAALNADQMREVLEVCQSQGVTFMEAFMYRFHPQWTRVKALMDDGAIGELRVISGSFSFVLKNPADIRMSPTMGGGALYDVGCYCVHAIQMLMGDEWPSEVHAVARFTNGVDTTLSAVLKFPSGVLGHFDCSFEAHRRQFVQLAGTDGALTLSLPFRPDHGTPTLELTNASGRTVETFHPFDIYVAEVEHFVSCVRNGLPTVNSPETSIRTLQIMDDIFAALHCHQ
ncbi:deoxyfructose oxidoreductase [Alicyclobacillus contaminans]|nr:deoxyfructose oxidoreductase [Alicyclobacillus contaminans]